MCEQVLPVLSVVKSPDEATDVQLELLKLLAEMSTFAPDLSNLTENLEVLFKRLVVS